MTREGDHEGEQTTLSGTNKRNEFVTFSFSKRFSDNETIQLLDSIF